MRVGILVPARNEGEVIERRLANLSHLDWPRSSAGAHRVLVVDDESTDDTVARAQEAAERHFAGLVQATVEVLPNRSGGGKAGAVTTGLLLLEREGFDLVVVTDADVVVDPGALLATVTAFGAEPRPGLVCGAQTFVGTLSPDGRAPTDARDLGGRYDHLTARVREFESRLGRLFSVHGQWMSWPLALGLRPPVGEVSDDIALALEVRRLGLRVEQVPGARFFELKPPPGPLARQQAHRRARGYFQLLEGSEPGPGGGRLDRLQWWLYRTLPRWAPEAVPLGFLAALVLGTSLLGPLGAGLVLGALLLFALQGGLLPLVRLLAIVRRARRPDPRDARLSDRWEMQRS